MFEKSFAKYARAVSDGRERKGLFNLFIARKISEIIFFALCAAIIIESIALSEAMETAEITDWPFILFGITLFLWVVSAVTALILWLVFRSTYKNILSRPERQEEMPEIATYRQRENADRKSSRKQLWWAWLVFGICAAAFIACIVMETIENPDGENFSSWGLAAFAVLLAGVLVLVLAYMIFSIRRQQKSATVEQQTSGEIMAIDEAQGREPDRELQSRGMNIYKYLFPNRGLRAEAEAITKKYSKIITGGAIAASVIAVAAVIAFIVSGNFGADLQGYAMPVALTIIFGTVTILTMPYNKKLSTVEKRQKAELESEPEYAKNLEWYNLQSNFNKFKGKIYLIFVAAGIILGWVLAILLPSTVWSLTAIIPVIVGLMIHSALYKGLRNRSTPIEKEIDSMLLASRDMRFRFEEGADDENQNIIYEGDSFMPVHIMTNSLTLHLGNTLYCLEVERESGRVINFSSGKLSLDEIAKGQIAAPQNFVAGNLFAKLTAPLKNGNCWTINFPGEELYDSQSKIYAVGKPDPALTYHKIFKNVYVQFDDDGILRGILCTDIECTNE